jgi:hypothetical protein
MTRAVRLFVMVSPDGTVTGRQHAPPAGPSCPRPWRAAPRVGRVSALDLPADALGSADRVGLIELAAYFDSGTR